MTGERATVRQAVIDWVRAVVMMMALIIVMATVAENETNGSCIDDDGDKNGLYKQA